MFEGEIWVIPVIVISLAASWLSVTLSRWANGKYLRPTISNWFMWWLFIQIYIGTIYLMVVRDSYEDEVGLFTYPEAIMGAWGLALAGIVLIPLGMNIANVFWRIQPNGVWERFVDNSQNILPKCLPKSFHIIFIGLTTITLLITLLYYQQIDIPIMRVFSGAEAKELALLRSDATNNFAGKYYRYNIFKTSLLTMLVLISFFLRHRGAYRYAFGVLLGIRTFACIADVQKEPIVHLVILLLLAWYFEKHVINKGILLMVGMLMVGVIITMYIFFMGADISNSELFIAKIGEILRRVFVEQSIGVEWSIVYVDRFGFLEGASMPNPAGLLPFTYVRYSVELMEMVFPQLITLGITGSMPTVFWGEIYANFGALIALISMIVVGILLRTMDIYFQTNKTANKSLNIALYVFMIMTLQRYTGTSILGFFVNLDIWATVLIIVFLSYLCRSDNRERETDSIGKNKNLAQICEK